MYSGIIEGVGPRYCPSIEDKIHRFADKDSHNVFLEPEGLETHELYPNGISTSLPFDVQLAVVRSIRGLENAHILRPGYAIEYDYFDPRNLKASLETKSIGGLFFAGALLRRADQWHNRLRRGRRAGSARGRQRGLAGGGTRSVVSAPRRGLSGRAGRRSDHPRGIGALSDVHLARGVPPAVARGQCGSAADREGAGTGARR